MLLHEGLLQLWVLLIEVGHWCSAYACLQCASGWGWRWWCSTKCGVGVGWVWGCV